MADNSVVANPGTGGALFPVDIDGSNRNWPYEKLAFGASGTQVEVADTDGNRLPTKPIGPRGSFTEYSGTIAQGGASQELAPANANRQYFEIWNPPSADQPIYVRFGSAATQDYQSIMMEPGYSKKWASPEFVSTDEIYVIAPDTGHGFTALEG